MKRNAINKLIAWKENKIHKPLWITGIKGVGKTYLAMDFAKSFYDGNLYVNFETSAAIRDLFAKAAVSVDNDQNLIELLCDYYQIPIELAGTLIIILDEIAECPEAVTALDSLTEAGNNVGILVISSNTTSVDLSKYELVHLYPMEFDEFLVAEGSEWYAEVIKGHYQTNRKVPEIVHNELLTLFEDYLLVGGMPAAVNDYLAMENTINVAQIHENIFQTMLSYAMNKNRESEALKISQIMNIIPEQLMKENKKFQYRMIRKGATYAQFMESIGYLVSLGYVYQSVKNELLQTEYQPKDIQSFQLYLSDVGILNSLLSRQERFLVSDPDQLKKTIMDSYMIQSLSARGHKPCFWESGSLAKVDYIIKVKDQIVPIEAKINDSIRSKSLGVFKTTHQIPYSIRVSSKNFEFTNQMKHIPYYAVFCLGDE